MSGQFVFPFGVQPALRPEDFIQAPCNEAAYSFVQRWPDWPARIAALHGPAGCGKSHLAAIWQGAAGAHLIPARHLSPDCLLKLKPAAAIVIEDLDRSDASQARDQALLALFERPKGAMLLTGRTEPGEWHAAIPDLLSRFRALLAFPLWAPDDALLSALTRRHFANRQLQVPDTALKRILNHVERTPEDIARFVARADEKALAEKRAITERLVLELIGAEQNIP